MIDRRSTESLGSSRNRRAHPIRNKSSAPVVRVLVADDHQLVRQSLRRILDSDSGLEVIGEAADGEEAVELARKLHPDVVLMDYNMPNMNGVEATRQIKQEVPSVAVVGLSVQDYKPLIESMKAAGAVACFTKGEDLDKLCDTLRAVGSVG